MASLIVSENAYERKRFPGWETYIEIMFNTINRFIEKQSGSNYSGIVIKKIERDGALLEVCFDSYGINDDEREIIRSIVIKTKQEVLPICAICGINKGVPPSSTVHPGLCESCRSHIRPSDYSQNMIVCITGKAGSGKDSIADYLVSKYGYKRIAFADPLRDIVQLAFVLDREHVWDRELREEPLPKIPKSSFSEYGDPEYWSVRKLLQFVGTELFRQKIWQDTWVENFKQRIEPGYNYVLTDVRSPNELDIKSNFGGTIKFVEVIRPGHDGQKVGICGHASEQHKLVADIVIKNEGTLQELYRKVDSEIADPFFIPF